MSEAADIRWENTKTLYLYKPADKDQGYELRIGSWVVNGKKLDPVLVKQEFKVTDSGKTMWGKIKGLARNDLYRVFEQGPQVAELMGFPMPKKFLMSAVETDDPAVCAPDQRA